MKKRWLFENCIQFECGMFSYLKRDIDLNFRTFVISLSFIVQFTVKLQIIANPSRTLISLKIKFEKYQFPGGNTIKDYLSWFYILITWEHPSFWEDCDYSDSRPNFKTFTISSFFITQWAIKSWIIALPLSFLIP